jgi:hypothetical protein
MQDQFSLLPVTYQRLRTSFSAPRLSTYLRHAKGNESRAIKLYRWNCQLSQSLYWPLQVLEIVYRNSITSVLVHKYGPGWHDDATFKANLSPDDSARFADAVSKQVVRRRTSHPAVDPITAELSFGFWLSLLSNRYEVPLGWAKRLPIAFPHLPAEITRVAVHKLLNEARDLRNRVAHHEPILQYNLEQRQTDVLSALGWMCPHSQWYVEQTCTLKSVLAAHP